MAVHIEPSKIDWTEDSGLYERLSKWVEDIEDIMLRPLIKVAKASKTRYLMCWLPDEAKSVVRAKELHESEDYEDILKCLPAWANPKTNKFMSFSNVRTLRQGEMTFFAFKTKAGRLVQDCQYPVGRDRLLQDIIVLGTKSMTAYRKVADKRRDITLGEVLEIYKNETTVDANLQITQQEMECIYIQKATIHYSPQKMKKKKLSTN